jgi:hypothetical protein
MKLLKWIRNLRKNNLDDMITEQQLISYQQNFSGQKFQWIKTDRPELIGKLVRVRDIRPQGRGAVAVFDDGSSVDVKDINNKLLMIHGDMQPLSIDEVRSIHAPKQSQGIPETKLPNGEVIPAINPSIDEYNAQAAPKPISPPQPKEVVNPFAMFNSDETEITIKVNVKMPDKKLLKMMYSNAEDKDIFIDQLSNYVTSMINNKVVSESVSKMLDPKPTTKEKTAPRAEVKLTEVNEKS